MSSSDAQVTPEMTLSDLAARFPGVIPVLERIGVDYCCGGRRPLAEAIADAGLDWTTVSAELEMTLSAPSPVASPASWIEASPSDLADHIVAHFHAKLREDLPRLTAMGQKVAGAHGERHPEVHRVGAVLQDLRAELDQHMLKEEQVLFPFIRMLDAGEGRRHPMLGRIASPIAVMEAEHEQAGAALAELHALTSGYTVPADACATFRGYYAGLASLERDLHEHIHLENNVLFPRARAMETSEVSAG